MSLRHLDELTTFCRYLFQCVSVSGSDVPHQDALHGTGVKTPQDSWGYLEFSQGSEVKQSPSISPQSQYAASRLDPQGPVEIRSLKGVIPSLISLVLLTLRRKFLSVKSG